MAVPLKQGDGAYPVYVVDASGVILPAVAGTVALADGADVAEGTIADAAVAAGATGTVSAKLRSISRDTGALTEAAPATDTASSGLNGRLQRIAQRLTSLIALWFATQPSQGAGITDAGTIRVVTASDGPVNAVLGVTTGAAVVTDANGTIQQYLRGLVKLWIAGLAAGEAHVGEVGGSSLTVTPTHTVDTAVYASGDCVGTIITITGAFRASGKEAILQSIRILDRSNQKPTGNLLFFNVSPTAATTTDNAPFVFSTDDLNNIARVPIVTSDYVTINSKAVANLSNLGRQVHATTGTSLFMVFVTDGAPDFVATTDFAISYSLLRD